MWKKYCEPVIIGVLLLYVRIVLPSLTTKCLRSLADRRATFFCYRINCSCKIVFFTISNAYSYKPYKLNWRKRVYIQINIYIILIAAVRSDVVRNVGNLLDYFVIDYRYLYEFVYFLIVPHEPSNTHRRIRPVYLFF